MTANTKYDEAGRERHTTFGSHEKKRAGGKVVEKKKKGNYGKLWMTALDFL